MTPKPWVGYDALSPAAQQAILHWTDVHTPAQLLAGARRFEWQEELLPTTVVIAKVMMAGDHAVDFKGNWYAYHNWYLSRFGVPDHGTSRWPIIESDAAELRAGQAYIDDGWHRFHSYVKAGDTHIPVLRARRLGR